MAKALYDVIAIIFSDYSFKLARCCLEVSYAVVFQMPNLNNDNIV